MTSSTDSPLATSPVGGSTWRAEAEGAQERALPSGRCVASCSAPLGSGGLGRHLQEIVEALGRRGAPPICIDGPPDAPLHPRRRRLRARALGALLSVPPLHLATAQRTLELSREFDQFAAARLPAAEHLIAFNGLALEQALAARRAGYDSVAIVSATTHFSEVVRAHERAHRQYPFEGSWAARLLQRNLREYVQADRIYLASEHARRSFLREGFPEERLAYFPLTPARRFQPPAQPVASETFDIVYVGSLSVVKGVPLLIDAVRALDHRDLRLVLVGGFKSRGMRRFLERACAQDPRIVVTRGDPLPRLQAARLCVHPSYNDGFGYAPAEAIACGLPVIVTEQTGMKELIERDGASGLVVPSGDRGVLSAAIDAAYKGELLANRSSPPRTAQAR